MKYNNMRKILILLSIILLSSCAPVATFVSYDVHENHSYVYDEDGVTELPPDTPIIGEKWIQYVGTVKQTYRPKKKFDYYSSVIVNGKFNYDYTYQIKGKIEISNKTKCYYMRENVNGEIKNYFINNGKRYIIQKNKL